MLSVLRVRLLSLRSIPLTLRPWQLLPILPLTVPSINLICRSLAGILISPLTLPTFLVPRVLIDRRLVRSIQLSTRDGYSMGDFAIVAEFVARRRDRAWDLGGRVGEAGWNGRGSLRWRGGMRGNFLLGAVGADFFACNGC